MSVSVQQLELRHQVQFTITDVNKDWVEGAKDDTESMILNLFNKFNKS